MGRRSKHPPRAQCAIQHRLILLCSFIYFLIFLIHIHPLSLYNIVSLSYLCFLIYCSLSSQTPPSTHIPASLVPGASAEGVDLLRRLLVLDPTRRISAAAALQHPFFATPLSSFSFALHSQNADENEFYSTQKHNTLHTSEEQAGKNATNKRGENDGFSDLAEQPTQPTPFLRSTRKRPHTQTNGKPS